MFILVNYESHECFIFMLSILLYIPSGFVMVCYFLFLA